MLCLKSRTQLTIISNDAPVMNEFKAPNKRIKLKYKNEKVGKVEKRLFETSQL